MRNPQGYAVINDVSADGGLVGEVDTFTCKHCQHIVHVPVRADPATMGGLCRQCMGLICPRCVDKQTCTPWEQSMARMEAREAARRSYAG